jgi:hypothetical protein
MIDFDYAFDDELLSYTLTTSQVGTVDAEGNYIDGLQAQSIIRATPMQPLKMNELQKLPDGEKEFSYVRLYTSANVNNSDIVNDGKNDYEVVQSEDRQTYFKVYLKRIT